MRVPITETVVDQLAGVLESGDLDEPANYVGAQFAARDRGYDELETFVHEADAATYYEAVRRAAERADAEIDLR